MKEQQNNEWKKSWDDDYLKWICGFANAQGGRLEIGKDNAGEVVGISNARRLLEDLPNKIRDLLGIMVAVNLKTAQSKEYLEIEVEPYPSAISLRGRYYVRSGSTNQELKGAALDRFMLGKIGRHWDDIPVPYASLKDLDPLAFKYFKAAAAKSGRMDAAVLKDTGKAIIDNLQLREGNYLRNAAVLLFHPNPEQFVPGAYVKIGFFRSAHDLAYQDEVHGNLFAQAQQTLDLLTTKYMKAYIHIRVYENRIRFYNDGCLPDGWTVKKLMKEHKSDPHNPLIAGAFFRTGDIEAWGRGIDTIREACREHGSNFPTFESEPTSMMIEFKGVVPDKDEPGTITDTGLVERLVETRVQTQVESSGRGQTDDEGSTTQETTQETSEKSSEKSSEKGSEKSSEKILELLRKDKDMAIFQLAEQIGITTRAIEKNIKKLQDTGKLRRVGPDKGGHWEVSEPQP